MKCKECKFFDNTKPVSTAKGINKIDFAVEYLGICTNNSRRIMAMNDSCPLFKNKEEKE